MTGETDSTQKDSSGKPRKKGRFLTFLRSEATKNDGQPGQHESSPHASSLFRHLQRRKLVDLTNAENNRTTLTNGVLVSATTSDVHSDKDDIWVMARNKLRENSKIREKLDRLDCILNERLGSDLKPVGMEERRQQILHFLNKETQRLKGDEAKRKLEKCSESAKGFFSSAVGFASAAMGIINDAAAPCLPASVACAGITLILTICVDAANQRHVLFEGLDVTARTIHRLAEYEDLIWTAEGRRFEEVDRSFTDACSNVIEFQARAVCHLQERPPVRELNNILKRDKWDDLLNAIRVSESRVSECATREGLRGIQEIRNSTSKNIRQQKVDAFLDLLFKNGCPYKDRKDINAYPQDGTCRWFLDNPTFKQWNETITGNQAEGIFLLTAGPGCGKSVLSKNLIDNTLRRKGRKVYYFLFKDGFEDQKSSQNAISAFLHQLFSSNSQLLTDAILELGSRQEFFSSLSDMWNTFIMAAHDSGEEVICVVDALDECQEHDRNTFIRMIAEIYTRSNKTSHNIRFLLTSRPYNHIKAQFIPHLKAGRAFHFDGDQETTADKVAAEIDIVVKARIEEIQELFDLNHNQCQQMRKQLQAVRSRNYLWVTILFNGLMKGSGITTAEILELAKNPPHEVFDAYERVLKRINSDSLAKAKRILHIILGAQRPFSLSEMSLALAYDGSQKDKGLIATRIVPENQIEAMVKNLCGFFVIVVDKRFYLLHQTAREFLVCDDSNEKTAETEYLSKPQNHGMTGLWQHSMDSSHSHSVLAETCMSYLSSDFASDHTSLLEYSAIYWVYHYHQSENNFQAAVEEMTLELCEKHTEWVIPCAKYNVIPKTGTSLCLASALGLERAVRLILWPRGSTDVNNGIQINWKDTKHGRTPLSWAAEKGHEAVIKLLLATGNVDVDSQDSDGRTPLSWAAAYGHEAVIKLLLATGNVDVDSQDSDGQTPLSWAAGNGREAVVKLLLATGNVDVDSKDTHFGRTPLSWAAAYGHEAVIKLLLATGNVDVDSQDSVGQTPLSWAAAYGHEAVIKLLLATGNVDVDSQDSVGQTPLSWAAAYGHEAVVKLLLATGNVDVDSKDTHFGRTPLSWAAENGHEAVVKLLQPLSLQHQLLTTSPPTTL